VVGYTRPLACNLEFDPVIEYLGFLFVCLASLKTRLRIIISI
jgi:hypothetical protein